MQRFGIVPYLLLLGTIFLIDTQHIQFFSNYERWHRLTFLEHRQVFFTVADSPEIILHEGLPHEREREVLQKEIDTQSIDKIGGFPFYSNTIKLTDPDKAWLKAFFQFPRQMNPYSGPKSCGGFHADYCVEWTVENHQYYCLICFGCHEAMLIVPDHAFSYRSFRCDRPEFIPFQYISFRCDLGTDESIHKLFNFLIQHRKSRPLSRGLQEMIDRYKEPKVVH